MQSGDAFTISENHRRAKAPYCAVIKQAPRCGCSAHESTARKRSDTQFGCIDIRRVGYECSRFGCEQSSSLIWI
jgi:hypothetical protein